MISNLFYKNVTAYITQMLQYKAELSLDWTTSDVKLCFKFEIWAVFILGLIMIVKGKHYRIRLYQSGFQRYINLSCTS